MPSVVTKDETAACNQPPSLTPDCYGDDVSGTALEVSKFELSLCTGAHFFLQILLPGESGRACTLGNGKQEMARTGRVR